MTDIEFTRIESFIAFPNNKDGTPKEEVKFWPVKGSRCGCKDDMGTPVINIKTDKVNLSYELVVFTTHINIVKLTIDENDEIQNSVIATIYPDAEKNLTYSKGYENGCEDIAKYILSELNVVKENLV